MTDIEKKALALVNEVRAEGRMVLSVLLCQVEHDPIFKALCRAIEQLEAEKAARAADRQEVSDAVEVVFAGYHDAPIPWVVMRRKLEPFIIAKPDPLVEAWDYMVESGRCDSEALRAAIEKRGGKIVWGEG